MLHVNINGKAGVFEEGISILQAVRLLGFEVPTLCYDERLKPYGGCRLCLVQVEGMPHPVPSCTTQLTDGLQIETDTEEVRELRRTLLQLLAGDYPRQAVYDDPEKEFHRYLRDYGLENFCSRAPSSSLQEQPHPYLHVDLSQCVSCFRCVRICEEVQGQAVWQIWHRGNRTRLLPDSQTTLWESSCVSCGACADSCPSGALQDQRSFHIGQPTNWTKTTCPYCGTGCEMLVGTCENQIVAIRPAQDAPVNRGHLCIKGRYAFDFVHAEDRITEPMIRQDGKWQSVSWNEAIRFTAARLQQIIKQHGADSIGVLGSARATNEENYVAQKFARVAIGTNNIDCCARVCHGPTAAAMKLMLGTGAATNSFNDIEAAQAFLLCGANATENHPIVGARIKQAVRRGAQLIVIDPRRIELADYADIHLQIHPGTNVPLLNAMACTIVEEGLTDRAFLSERVSAWPEFHAFIGQYSPEKVAEVCGVESRQIRRAARLYANAKPAMCFHGLGVTEHTQGTEGVMALVNLALLTGNLGKRGSGINPLRGQNNVQGSAHMGCEPNHLTGYAPIADGRERFEQLLHTTLPVKPGMNLMEMMSAAQEGKLKALWAIGYDIFLTNAEAHQTARALQNLELVIIQDLFMNETARAFGTVFFPVASSFEKDGTFMNAERRIQRVRKAIEPLGKAKSDWQIIGDVAQAMGKREYFAFENEQEIWDEIRKVWQAGSGITYPRLEHGGLQWPCPDETSPGTEILHRETFPIGRRAALRCITYRPTAEVISEAFPFLLNTGRALYQFNAGTMTMRTPNREFLPTDFLYIAPEDAARLGLQNGKAVRLISRYGKTVLPIHIHSSIRQGELFATFHATDVFLNRLTSPYRDAYVHTPEYKVTAVRIEVLLSGESL